MSFYSQFKLDKNLSREEIQARLEALKEEMGQVQGDLARRRLRDLEEAILVFSSPEARYKYDQDLDQELIRALKMDRILKDYDQKYGQKALALHRSGQGHQALDLAQEGLKAEPKLGEAWSILGLVQAGILQYDQAIESHKRAIELEPNEALYLNNLAYLYLELGRHAEALDLADRSIDLERDFHENYILKSQILRELERYDEAIELIKEALLELPGNPALKEEVAYLYYLKGMSHCLYLEEDDGLVVVSGESIPLIVENMEKAKSYHYLKEYDDKIAWAQSANQLEFDRNNLKLFIFPVLALGIFKNFLGLAAAIISSYIILKSSRKTVWELNREKYLGEDLTMEKAKASSQDLIRLTEKGFNQAKDLLESKTNKKDS